MKNKFISVGNTLMGIALFMLVIDVIFLTGSINDVKKEVEQLKIQVETLTEVNAETKQDIAAVASNTDAQLTIINESIDENKKDNEKLNKEIQDLKKESEISKEVNDVIEEKATYDESVEPMSVDESIPEPVEEIVSEPEVEPEPEPEVSAESSDVSGMTFMGCWEISAYEETGNCCANGNYPTVWYTCAFNEAPLGATIYVEGLGYFVNEDICGTPGRLDIYLGDVGVCEQFGIQYHNVYIVN